MMGKQINISGKDYSEYEIKHINEENNIGHRNPTDEEKDNNEIFARVSSRNRKR